MSTQVEHTRPDTAPPDDRPKQAMETVIAHGPDGQLFEIPLAEAQKFAMPEDRQRELNLCAPGADEDEVGGRHRVLLTDGTFGFHSNWLWGTYLWWRNLQWYTGWHWHPYRSDPRAYDRDDY